MFGQALRDASRGQYILAAGKTMGEQRIRADSAIGRFETGRQYMAMGAGEVLPGRFHTISSLAAAQRGRRRIVVPHGHRCRRLGLTTLWYVNALDHSRT